MTESPIAVTLPEFDAAEFDGVVVGFEVVGAVVGAVVVDGAVDAGDEVEIDVDEVDVGPAVALSVAGRFWAAWSDADRVQPAKSKAATTRAIDARFRGGSFA